MAKIKRSIPRRRASRYPLGTTLTFRDGRVFVVSEYEGEFWDDPSYGNGGGEWVTRTCKYWASIEKDLAD